MLALGLWAQFMLTLALWAQFKLTLALWAQFKLTLALWAQFKLTLALWAQFICKIWGIFAFVITEQLLFNLSVAPVAPDIARVLLRYYLL